MNPLIIEDAKWRIKELYQRTNGKCVISFSGGKDSTVVAELYLQMREENEIGYIPIVYADTQVEYNAINEFIEWFSKHRQEVIKLKPSKPFGQVLKEYGKPAMSKVKSDFLSTYQNTLAKGNDPLKVKRTSELVTGFRTNKNYEITTEPTRQRLANKHFHFLHPEHESKIGSKCCYYMKKQPFEKYYIENDIDGYITGMRSAEGGIRSEMYKSCTAQKVIKGKTLIHKMPLFDWSDKDVDSYIEEYNVEISKAYTEYGLDRTGCIGCPFAKDIHKNLKVLHDYEPNKYKAVKMWLGDVYRDLEIKLPFDDEYMETYWKHLPVLEQRRYEMLKKYRPKIAEKYKPQPPQISIYDALKEDDSDA